MSNADSVPPVRLSGIIDADNVDKYLNQCILGIARERRPYSQPEEKT